jgi:hypothetical protein
MRARPPQGPLVFLVCGHALWSRSTSVRVISSNDIQELGTWHCVLTRHRTFGTRHGIATAYPKSIRWEGRTNESPGCYVGSVVEGTGSLVLRRHFD